VTPEQMARVTPRLNMEGECWVWTGAKSDGYGQVRLKGNARSGYVHRLVYEHYRGPVPDGLQIDHLCRNRACANPSHLEPVTQRENLLRGATITAAAAARTHCTKGHPLDGRRKGGRYCLTCSRAWTRDRDAKKKANK